MMHFKRKGHGPAHSMRMEAEGTVVYFETSPSAQQLETGSKESDIRDELTFSHITSDQDNRLPADEANSESPSLGVASRESGEAVRTFIQHAARGLWRWLLPHTEEDNVLLSVISSIKTSPLLTDEDFQILQLPLIEGPDTLTACEGPSMEAEEKTSVTRLYWFVFSVCVALMAASMSLGRGWFFTVCAAFGFSAVLCGVRVLSKKRDKMRLARTAQIFKYYSGNFEKLLSLLSDALRTIQEIEIVARGYSRPSRSVPISRLEDQSSTLQCVVLRQRVFRVCQTGVRLLRNITKRLCSAHPLIEDLDRPHCYLASRPLNHLHQHMKEEGGVWGEDGDTEPSDALMLDSLKDACSLIAVQNSELLRRLGLLLGFKRLTYPTKPNTTISKVDLLVESLKEPSLFVERVLEQLAWSLQYQKDFLFGDPPIRAVSKSSVESSDTLHPALQPVVDDMHCLDIKLQVTLQSVRDLGTVALFSSGNEPSEKEVLLLREQLLSVMSNTERCSEHAMSGLTALDKILSPSIQLVDTEQDGNCDDCDTADLEEIGRQSVEDSSDDDDLVFEAYVPPLNSKAEEDDSGLNQLTERDKETLKEEKEAKEVPLHILKELNSVLAVRNQVKERKQLEKRKRRLQPANEDPSQEPVCPEQCRPVKDPVNLVHPVKDPSQEPVNPEQYHFIPVSVTDQQRSLAQAAAAAAIRTKRHLQTEELYETLAD